MRFSRNFRISPRSGVWILLSCLLFWGWIGYYADVYLNAFEVLPRDNGKYHYPIFLYVIRSFELLGEFPRWMYSNEGGIWIETLANNFLLLMPHRWIGYVLSVFFHCPPLLAYKVSLLLGQLGFLIGVFWLALELHWSTVKSCVLLIGFFFSGAVLSFLHQEHALGSLFFIPYMWISLLKARRRPIGFVAFAVLLGLSCNHHYPQLILIYWLAVFLSMGASFTEFRADVFALGTRLRLGGVKLAVLSIAGFLISASPVLYSYGNFKDKLESPFRHQKGGIATTSYADYEHINSAFTKVDPRNFPIFFRFNDAPRWNITILDDTLFYVAPCFLFLLLILLTQRMPKRGFHLSLLLILAFLSVGTYTGLPKLLMGMIPGLKLFRQWYFFLAFLGLHAVYAMVSTFDSLAQERWNFQRRAIWLGTAFVLSFAAFPLPWTQVVPGVLVCLFLGYYVKQNRPGVLRGLLYGWLIVGSLQGARFILGTYRENLIPLTETPLYGSSQRLYALDPAIELRNIYLSFVAVPSGMTKEARKEVAAATPFLIDGVPGRGSQSSHRGIEIPISAGGRHFKWMQFNDGNWEFWGGNPKPLRLLPATGFFPSVALQGDESLIVVRRRASPWHWLILLMWLPLGALILIYRIRADSPKEHCVLSSSA